MSAPCRARAMGRRTPRPCGVGGRGGLRPCVRWGAARPVDARAMGRGAPRPCGVGRRTPRPCGVGGCGGLAPQTPNFRWLPDHKLVAHASLCLPLAAANKSLSGWKQCTVPSSDCLPHPQRSHDNGPLARRPRSLWGPGQGPGRGVQRAAGGPLLRGAGRTGPGKPVCRKRGAGPHRPRQACVQNYLPGRATGANTQLTMACITFRRKISLAK